MNTNHTPPPELLCLLDAEITPKPFQKLTSEGQESYTCRITGQAANRNQIKIFTAESLKPQDGAVEVFVVKGKNKKDRLCTLTYNNSSFEWTKSESGRDLKKLLCVDELVLEAVVSDVITSDSKENLESTPLVGSPSITDIGTPSITDMKNSPTLRAINESTPITEVSPGKCFSTPKISKKRHRDGDTTPNPKSRRHRVAMRALSTNVTPPAKLKAHDSHALYSPARLDTENVLTENSVKCSIPKGKPTRCVDLSGRVPKPSSRWGHSLTCVNSELAVLVGGQGDKSLSKDSIWYLNPEMRTWKCPEVVTEGIKPEYRIGHSATYDPTMRCIYVYGGSKNAKWFHDVHMFDLDEQKWSLVKADGKAPTRAYHTSTLYRHELWVFGGVFPRPDPQPDGCDNEVHIFSPVMQSWYKPIVMGDKPSARSGHSASLINDMLVVFGGWDFPYCYNDIFILDLTTVEWSEPKCFGKPPKPRSWHACSTLAENRIFIHGGYDGDNALHDAHIFDYYSKTWQELILENGPSARAGHSCLRVHSEYEDQEEDEIIVFGGGDNDGAYFSDMLSFYVPHNPMIVEATE